MTPGERWEPPTGFWELRIGDEGYFVESPTGERWGLNHVYGKPETLVARLRDLHNERAGLEARLVEEAQRGLKNGQARIAAGQALTAERERADMWEKQLNEVEAEGDRHAEQYRVRAEKAESDLQAERERAEKAERLFHECEESLNELRVGAEAEAQEAHDELQAEREKAASPIVHDDSGLVALCRRCGFVTWHEKDGEVQHEADCALLSPAPADGTA